MNGSVLRQIVVKACDLVAIEGRIEAGEPLTQAAKLVLLSIRRMADEELEALG